MLGDAFTVGVLFFLGFLALSASVLTILRYWLVEGTLDGAPAVALLGGVLGLAVLAIKSGSPLLITLVIALLVVGSVLVPSLASRAERGALHRMHEEDIAKYLRALEVNPQNASAWREIAEIYMRMDRYDQAIDAYKEAIRLNPHDVQKIRRRLNQALDYRAGMPGVETVVCDECGQETPKRKVCLHCGATLEMNFLEWLLHPENLKDVLKPTVILTAGVLATGAVFAALPIAVKAVLVGLCVLVAAYFVWRIVEDA